VTQARPRCRVSTRYCSSVDSNVQDHDPRHLRIPSTLSGAPMEDSCGHGRHLQSVYDIAPVPPGTTQVLFTSIRNGRRIGTATTSRIKEDALDGEAHPLRTRPPQEALVPLRVEALGLATDHGRCIAFHQRRTFAILTSCCHCLKPWTALRKAYVVGGSRVPVQKSR
jgi:hypothetical protein